MFKLEIETRYPTGNAKRHGVWTDGDVEFLSNPKAIAKLRQKLNALPYNLNFKILMSSDLSKSRERAVTHPIEVLPDFINVSILNNVTTLKNWIPPTAWILCHRMAHMMYGESSNSSEDSRPWTNNYRTSQGPEYALWCGLAKIWQYVHGFSEADKQRLDTTLARGQQPYDWHIMNSGLPSLMDKWAGMLVMSLFTMRSARERIIGSDLDVFAEALAQHMINGRFRLKRWNDSVLPGLKEWDDWKPNTEIVNYGSKHNWSQDRVLRWKNFDVEVVDEMISELEDDVNTKISELLQRIKGKHLVF